MGNTHFFIAASRIGYFLGNTQFALLEIKLYAVWGLYLWALKGVKDKGGYCVGNTQFCIIAEKLYVFVWFYDWFLYICTYDKRSR